MSLVVRGGCFPSAQTGSGQQHLWANLSGASAEGLLPGRLFICTIRIFYLGRTDTVPVLGSCHYSDTTALGLVHCDLDLWSAHVLVGHRTLFRNIPDTLICQICLIIHSIHTRKHNATSNCSSLFIIKLNCRSGCFLV